MSEYHGKERRAGASRGRRESDRFSSRKNHHKRHEFLRRLRKPLIGLGMIAAAIPMARAMQAEHEEESSLPDEDEAAGERASAPEAQPAAAGPPMDAEERIASTVGQARADVVRTDSIQKACDRYGISDALASDIYDVAVEEGIDPNVAFGLVKTESTFRERAVSHVGARGLTQVMPRTARWLVPGTSAEDLFDRKTNLRLGFRYLDQLIDKYDGNLKLALTAYNRGPGTVDRVLSRGGDPDNGYAGKVLRG